MSDKKSRKGICFNTGRTHFKSGMTPWNKGIPMSSKDKKHLSKVLEGRPMPKPNDFSETMRKVNPPFGRKIQFDSRRDKKSQIWRRGYVWVYLPDYPSSRKKPPDFGYIQEHRYLLEKHIGRPLERNETIHHIDGNKSNNKLANLILCSSGREHNLIHEKMEIFVESLIRQGKVYYDQEKKEFFFR